MQSLAEISLSSPKAGDVITLNEREMLTKYSTPSEALRELGKALQAAASRNNLLWSAVHSAEDGIVRVRFWEKGQ